MAMTLTISLRIGGVRALVCSSSLACLMQAVIAGGQLSGKLNFDVDAIDATEIPDAPDAADVTDTLSSASLVLKFGENDVEKRGDHMGAGGKSSRSLGAGAF